MGYDPHFIDGFEIPLPAPEDRVVENAFNDGNFIHHTRYSVLFNQKRGFAACTAHNVDGSSLPEGQYTSRSFRFDPHIKPNSIQVDNKRGYRSFGGSYNPWDRGHLVRRKSMSWGEPDIARICERESDYYSNIVPQHEALHDNAWGPVEDWMMGLAEDGHKRACVFAGAVFTPEDIEHQNAKNEQAIQIPAGFWKIIAILHQGEIKAAAFLLLQEDYDRTDPLVFDPVLEQVRISNIAILTGLDFGNLSSFDPLKFEFDFLSLSHASPRNTDTLSRNTWNSICLECEGVFPDFDAAENSEIDPRVRLQIRSRQDIVL